MGFPTPYGGGPNLLAPSVPSRNPNSISIQRLTSGIRDMRLHHPDLSRSCHRLAAIAYNENRQDAHAPQIPK